MDRTPKPADDKKPTEKPREDGVHRVLTPAPADAPQEGSIPSKRGPKFVDDNPPAR